MQNVGPRESAQDRYDSVGRSGASLHHDGAGGVWYQTPPAVLDESAMTFREVAYRPTRHSSLVVNTWNPTSLVTTYFMSNGMPVSYNLAILGAYIQQRHGSDYDDEVRRQLLIFTQNRGC